MATVASQLTRIHDVEGSLTLTSIGGGAGGGANTEVFLQGSQAAGRKQSNATDHGFFLTVSSRDVSGAGVHVGVWVNHIHYAVLTKFAFRIGSATTAYHEHAYPLAAWPSKGGWVRAWIDVSRTPEASAGTFNKAALTQLAVLASLPSVGGNAPNIVMDASDMTTGGLLLTGTNGVFADFVAADEGNGTNKYGVVFTEAGAIFCLARLTLGSASSLAFGDSGFVLIFPDQSLAAPDFMGVTVDLQNASTAIAWSNGVVRSAGAVRGDLVASGISGSFSCSNSSLANLRVITLTSACTLTGCLIAGSGVITASGAALVGCTIVDSTAAAALLWNTNSNPAAQLEGTEFSSGGSGHAIEFGPNTPDEIGLVDVGFVGYGADDTADAAVFNDSGKEITINISGGDSPTLRNGSGASTILVTDTRSFAFSVADASGAPVTGYEWRLYEASGTPGTLGTVELAGEESATSASQNYLYSYSTDTDVVLQVLHADFVEVIIRTTLINADRSVSVVLQSEENA